MTKLRTCLDRALRDAPDQACRECAPYRHLPHHEPKSPALVPFVINLILFGASVATLAACAATFWSH